MFRRCIWISCSIWADKWFAKPYWWCNPSSVTRSCFTLHVGWVEREAALRMYCNLYHPGVNISIPRHRTLKYRLCWLPSSLLSCRFRWLHKRSNPSLAYHPTCEGTPLQAVRQHLNLFRVWQITVYHPRHLCTWIKVTSQPEMLLPLRI